MGLYSRMRGCFRAYLWGSGAVLGPIWAYFRSRAVSRPIQDYFGGSGAVSGPISAYIWVYGNLFIGIQSCFRAYICQTAAVNFCMQKFLSDIYFIFDLNLVGDEIGSI